jgi:hypothetical protein
MANPNPYQGRQAVRRNAGAGKAIDLVELRQIMSDFIIVLQAHAGTPDEPADIAKLKDVGYLLIQAVGTYVKVTEAGELEARHKAMEARMHALEQEARNARIPA